MAKSSVKRLKRLSEKDWKELTREERKLIENMLPHLDSVRDVNEEYVVHRTFGQRAADGVAKVAGSWTFIITFIVMLLMWAFLNTEVLGPRHEAFDPYPYIFLNLVLSMLAAVQAPIIMMSQNRQSARDRLDAEIDHEVNVRAEFAIKGVDERIQALELKLDEAAKLLLAQRQTTPPSLE
ncbi:MAG: DUF1003 domain-containing protein [Pseudomonadota bacterium]